MFLLLRVMRRAQIFHYPLPWGYARTLCYEKHNVRVKRRITGYKLNLDLTAYCSFTELSEYAKT